MVKVNFLLFYKTGKMQEGIMIQKLEDDYIHLSVFLNENRRKWYKTVYQTS